MKRNGFGELDEGANPALVRGNPGGSSSQEPSPLPWDVRGSNNIEQRNVDITSPTTTTSLHVASSIVVSTTFSVYWTLENPYHP
jgi:hypothetical protein